MNKTKVAAYCRVSTNTKDQKNSFKNQKEYFEKIERESENYELVHIYADEGISAVRLKKRDQFLQMIFDAGVDVKVDGTDYMYKTDNKRKPKFEKILIKDISRFSRNLDTISLVRALRRKGVALVLNGGIEIATEADELNLSMLLTFAQHESVDRSKKIRFGLTRSAENGVIKMARQLYGYGYDPEKKEIYIVPEEAKIVQMIFDMYVNKNLGVRRIMSVLKNPELNIKTRNNNDFGYSTISRMISNRKYCGDLVYLKYDSGTVLDKNATYKVRPEKDWIIKEDKIPAIIDRDLFDKAQELRKKRGEENGKYKGKRHPVTEYSNLIVCSNCGAYYGRNKANGHYFLNCLTKKKYGVKGCDYPNFKVAELDKILDDLTTNFHQKFISLKEHKVKKLEELKTELNNKINAEVPPAYYEKKVELEKFNNQKQKILDLYLEDTFDKKMLDEKASSIDKSIISMKKELTELYMPLQEIEKHVKEIEERIEELQHLRVKKNLKREDVLQLIDRIDVFHTLDNIILEVRFKINETINKAIGELNSKDMDEMLEVPFVYSLKASSNIPIRLPNNIKVPEGVNLKKLVKDLNVSIENISKILDEH